MDSSDIESSDSHSAFTIEDDSSEDERDNACLFLSDDEEVIDKDIEKLLRVIEQRDEDEEPTCVSPEEQPVTDISACLQSCLELNREKQRLLREKFVEIQRIIGEIENFDSKVQQLLSRDNRKTTSSNWWGEDHTGRFDKPYFKDKRLFPPPQNQDTITKQHRGELDIATILRQNKWQRWEMKLLDDAVHKNAYEILLAPLTARKERWENELLVKSKLNQDTSEFKEKLKKLQDEIKELTGEPLFEMLSDPEARIDWMKISATDMDGRRSASECRGMWRMCLMVGINRKPWTKKETEHLMNVIRCHDFAGWEEIAEEVAGRTSYQCFIHCQVVMNRERFKWTPTEDRKLRYLVKKFREGDKIPFTIISRYMPGRTAANVRQRWRDSLNPLIRTGKYTVREDLILATARYAHDMSFKQIASLLPGRTEQQLRSRYSCLENIHPSTPFTPEEDERLVNLAQSANLNWADLVKEFPLRTRAQLRGRYIRLLKNAKANSRMTTSYSMKKSLVWETLKDKVKNQKDLNPGAEDIVLSVVQKPYKPMGRKFKHRDKFDKEISQIFRTHYAQPKGRKKKHYTTADITMIGEKGRQIADVLKANVNWAPLRENDFEDASQYHLYSELRKANENTGWDSNGTTLTHCIAPNVATIVGLRTLLLVEPFLLRWSFESNKTANKKEEEHTISKCGDKCRQISFRQACELFKQRCMALFLWPMFLSQQGPPRTCDVFADKESDQNEDSNEEEEEKEKEKSKHKMTKSDRKRWLKARWQKYREEKETLEPRSGEASTSGTQTTSLVVMRKPGRKKKEKPDLPVIVKPKGKPGRKRKQPVETPPEEVPEVKKDKHSTKNKQGKHVPNKC